MYFGLDVFCMFEARVPEFAMVYTSIAAQVLYYSKEVPFAIHKILASVGQILYIKPKIQ